jgi:NAD(P)-dependent dehydrogenase (short-subunit alcohol dehydrogenase family)
MNDARFDFADTAVLVTGGTSGIGHAIATGFAAAGADVVITGTRARAADYDTDLAAFAYRQLQLTERASVDALVASLDRLDVIVNNAGANLTGGIDEWDPDGFASAVALNLIGPMRLTVSCRSFLFASSLPGGASVINLASMGAFRTTPVVPGYSSAKAGVVAFTANLARKWARKGVRVNAVAPGIIDTPMTAPMQEFPDIAGAELAHIPMGRFGRAGEVVGATMFLASSAAAYITGHTLAVDGGYLAG